MKKLLSMLVSFSITSTSLFAADTGLMARYKFSVSDGNRHYSSYISELYSNKKLVVKLVQPSRSNLGNSAEIVRTIVKKMNLSSSVFEMLKEDVIDLAHAEIVTVFSPVVCAMMPTPEISNNFLEVNREFTFDHPQFGRDLVLVNGPHGCWVSEKTHPENGGSREAAHLLERSLKMLSL